MSTVRVYVILIFAAAVAVPLAGLAFVTGPVSARTGGFGEMTCHECHWDNPVNDPSGRLTLLGTPATYTPGARYSIIVDLARPDLVLGGFQLSARFGGGSSAGTNAGVLRPIDELAERVADEEWTYQLRPAHQGRRHRGKAGRRSMDAGVDRARGRCAGRSFMPPATPPTATHPRLATSSTPPLPRLAQRPIR